MNTILGKNTQWILDQMKRTGVTPVQNFQPKRKTKKK